MKEMGIAKVYLTPHIMVDWPKNSPEFLKARFSELKSQAPEGIEIELAAEYMLDCNFLNQLKKPLLCFKEKRVLVETSYIAPPPMMKEQIYQLQLAGYQPIIAHPERYEYLTKEMYDSLKANRCQFQLNLFSLLGFYGNYAKRNAYYLLRNGYYNYIGSDTHHLRHLKRLVKKCYLSRSTFKLLAPLFESNRIL